MADARERALENYRKKLTEHRELDARLKEVREQEKKLQKDYDKSTSTIHHATLISRII